MGLFGCFRGGPTAATATTGSPVQRSKDEGRTPESKRRPDFGGGVAVVPVAPSRKGSYPTNLSSHEPPSQSSSGRNSLGSTQAVAHLARLVVASSINPAASSAPLRTMTKASLAMACQALDVPLAMLIFEDACDSMLDRSSLGPRPGVGEDASAPLTSFGIKSDPWQFQFKVQCVWVNTANVQMLGSSGQDDALARIGDAANQNTALRCDLMGLLKGVEHGQGQPLRTWNTYYHQCKHMEMAALWLQPCLWKAADGRKFIGCLTYTEPLPSQETLFNVMAQDHMCSEYIPYSVTTVDEDGFVCSQNASARALFGAFFGLQINGRGINFLEELFHGHLELREKMQRQLKKASSFQVCVALLSPLLRQWLNVQDGDEVWHQLYITRIAGAGSASGVPALVIVQPDITDMVLTERKVAELQNRHEHLLKEILPPEVMEVILQSKCKAAAPTNTRLRQAVADLDGGSNYQDEQDLNSSEGDGYSRNGSDLQDGGAAARLAAASGSGAGAAGSGSMQPLRGLAGAMQGGQQQQQQQQQQEPRGPSSGTPRARRPSTLLQLDNAANAAALLNAAGQGRAGSLDGGSVGAGAGAAAATAASLRDPKGHIWMTQQDVKNLATNHPEVTILFADIKGFTALSQELHPAEVMLFLNQLYSIWDAMLDVYQVYKVETIGDSYMVAGGLFSFDPATGGQRLGGFDPRHAQKVVDFGRAMLEAASLVLDPKGNAVQIRIGIHSGSCVSGVVGQRMPRFCLFGDTINTASRMESTCPRPGCIHASEATRSLLPHEPWEATGGVFCKGKGMMQTSFLPVTADLIAEAERQQAAQKLEDEAAAAAAAEGSDGLDADAGAADAVSSPASQPCDASSAAARLSAQQRALAAAGLSDSGTSASRNASGASLSPHGGAESAVWEESGSSAGGSLSFVRAPIGAGPSSYSIGLAPDARSSGGQRRSLEDIAAALERASTRRDGEADAGGVKQQAAVGSPDGPRASGAEPLVDFSAGSKAELMQMLGACRTSGGSWLLMHQDSRVRDGSGEQTGMEGVGGAGAGSKAVLKSCGNALAATVAEGEGHGGNTYSMPSNVQTGADSLGPSRLRGTTDGGLHLSAATFASSQATSSAASGTASLKDTPRAGGPPAHHSDFANVLAEAAPGSGRSARSAAGRPAGAKMSPVTEQAHRVLAQLARPSSRPRGIQERSAKGSSGGHAGSGGGFDRRGSVEIFRRSSIDGPRVGSIDLDRIASSSSDPSRVSADLTWGSFDRLNAAAHHPQQYAPHPGAGQQQQYLRSSPWQQHHAPRGPSHMQREAQVAVLTPELI